MGVQVVGKDRRKIRRYERLPLPLRGTGDHDRLRLSGQIQRQKLRPQFPELLRHDGARLAVRHEFLIELREDRLFRQCHADRCRCPYRLRFCDSRSPDFSPIRHHHGYRRCCRCMLRLRELHGWLLPGHLRQLDTYALFFGFLEGFVELTHFRFP